MTNDLTLESGHWVQVIELHQRKTYDGLLEGLPTKERNQRYLAGLLKQKNNYYNCEPYLLGAPEKALEYFSDRAYPFGTPSALPSVTCICRLESFQPTRNEEGDSSGLVVIWFQDKFQYPPPEDIQSSLRAIDWEKHAGNFYN